MPKPKPDEDKRGFIARCMGDEEALRDFPRADQRHAFCQSQWDRAQEAAPAIPSGEPANEPSVTVKQNCPRCGKPVVLVDNASTCPGCQSPIQAGPKATHSSPGEIAEWVKGKKKRKKESVAALALAARQATGLSRAAFAEALGAQELTLAKLELGEDEVGPLGRAMLQVIAQTPSVLSERVVEDHHEECPDMVRAMEGAGLLEGDVLDFGAGYADHGYTKWDPYVASDPHALCRRYDTVVLANVLDVLSVPERMQVLAAARGVLREGGRILAAVRCRRGQNMAEEDIANLGLGYSDGWATGRAYQSGWLGDEWHNFFVDQAWNPTGVEIDGLDEGQAVFSLEPAPEQTQAPVGKTEDDVQRGQSSYEAESALAEGHALAKRWHGTVE